MGDYTHKITRWSNQYPTETVESHWLPLRLYFLQFCLIVYISFHVIIIIIIIIKYEHYDNSIV